MGQGTRDEQSLPPPIPQEKRLLLSPSDISADADGSMRWWKPTWRDIARRLGLKWLYIVPVAALVIGSAWMCLFRFRFVSLWLSGWKIWMLLIAGAIGAVAQAIRSATKARAEPFCIHCGYTLAGLPDQHICPECGRPYSFDLIRQYQQDPRWFVRRWKMQHGNPINERFEAGKSVGRASEDGT